jgi:hypothetical protein
MTEREIEKVKYMWGYLTFWQQTEFAIRILLMLLQNKIKAFAFRVWVSV